MRNFAALLLLLVTTSLPAQENTCQSLLTRKGLSQRASVPIGSCGNCHTGSTLSPLLAARLGNPDGNRWIRGDEILIWLGQKTTPDNAQAENSKDLSAIDRHSQAWTSLRSKTAEQMGKVLGKPNQLHRDPACLACHSSLPVYELEKDSAGLVSAHYETDIRLTSGVSCEGCHGPAGDSLGADGPQKPGWGTAHVSPDNWRYLTPAEKCDHGYYDVRSVVSRTRLCVSCHVGNAELGRVITHEMYAAGHPPLPPFELQTFEQQMPRHWQEYHEKPQDMRTRFEAQTSYQPAEPTELKTRELLISALVTWSESLKLTADLAEQKTVVDFVKSPWPEFAQFDCYACHHDLRHDGWRQQSQVRGRPGRPRLTPWPATLAELAWQITSTDPASGSSAPFAGFASVQQASVAAPFGDTVELMTATRSAAAAADQLIDRLQNTPLTAQQQQAVSTALLQKGTSGTVDYDSARQLAWSWLLLNSTDQNRQSLFPELFLQLHQGRAEADPIPGSENLSVTVIRIDPALSLPPIANYDPISFRKAFEALSQSPPPRTP